MKLNIDYLLKYLGQSISLVSSIIKSNNPYIKYVGWNS